MAEEDLSEFEVGVEFGYARDKLGDQAMEVELTVKRPDDAINSPTHVTNCLYYFRKAKKFLDKYPHSKFAKELAETYLKFEELRKEAQRIIGKEYEKDNKYYRAMMDSQEEFEQAKREAESMLEQLAA